MLFMLRKKNIGLVLSHHIWKHYGYVRVIILISTLDVLYIPSIMD